MQSDCSRCRKLLWSYLAKELSSAETQKIEEHLQGCPSCRQEAAELSLIVASLSEEVPLPENFSQELHEKLVSVAEEMATETPSWKEKLLNGLRALPRSQGFRTLAPALACLVLVVGVFSTGLFDKWNSADDILKTPVSGSDKPAPVSVATEEPPVSSDTPKAEIANTTNSTVPAVSVPTEEPQPTEEPAVVLEPPQVASQPAPASTEGDHLPAPASVEEDTHPTTFQIPRHRPEMACLNVTDAEDFLNNWHEDWRSSIQDVVPEELISGVDPNAIILKLNRTAFDSLLEYYDTQEPLEVQGETLIIIAEDEE